MYEGLLDHEARRAEEPVVGLTGTKDKEPEVPLSQMERFLSQRADGDVFSDAEMDKLLDYLQEETGRSRSALKNSFQNENRTPEADSRLRIACGNDDTLYRRVLPWAGLVRDDDFGYPVVIPAGSVYVTAGTARRATGTHYTPRSLTEPIVQHTLEPLVYNGPAQGQPREEWQLRTPRELLALKVCDMAMGSGAFLVQACRYLSERLVEAWSLVDSERLTKGSQQLAEDSEQSQINQSTNQPINPITNYELRITPEGTPATGHPKETILPPGDEERLTLARRLVVDRCLYGVDKNRLAVEMAKLSLWLVTLDKNRPFTFLNHALRHGDSLIGADEEMFLRWAHGLRDSSMPLFDQEIRKLVTEAKEKRQALQAFDVRDVRDAEEKARLLAEAEAATERIKLGCDLLVGARLLAELTQSKQDALLANGLLDYVAGDDWQDPMVAKAVEAAKALPAFHWPFEFPEVFAGGGFNATVGNPPFIGGRRIRDTLGNNIREAINILYPDSSGNADYCAFFFIKGFENLRNNGALGLIATNTIAQGDTLQTGLDKLNKKGGIIYRANVNYSWPGQAAVVVDIVHEFKGEYHGVLILDDERVENITPMLDSMPIYGKPFQLEANAGKSFQGSLTRGMGFVISVEEAQQLIKENERNREVVRPFLNGRDLNSDPTSTPSRWVIDFKDWELSTAETYVEPMKIIKERVYPDRMTKEKNRKIYKKIWWQFWRPRIELYETIDSLSRVLVIALTSNTMAFTFMPKDIVFSHATVVIAYDDACYFGLLMSTIHTEWARLYGSSMKGDSRYTPTDCFQTFPFPKIVSMLYEFGENYYDHRSQVMIERQEGITAIYNRFNDPEETAEDITHLRQLHVEMDNAVAAAYGWQDLPLNHDFHDTPQGVRFTISEAARRQVLTRLLKLNHQRYEEEVKLGLHGKKKSTSKKTKSRKKKKKNDGQLSLF